MFFIVCAIAQTIKNILYYKGKIIMALIAWINRIPRELKLFALASLAMGLAYSVYDSTFNNFLNASFNMSGGERSFLEMPRELPGILVVATSALFWFLCSRRLGALSLALGALGTLLIGFGSSTYAIMVVWLFIYSVGQHTMMPLASSIGMELASAGKVGQRLGQLNALRNLAAILGSFVVFVGFQYLGFSFQHTFVITAVMLAVGAVLMFMMKPTKEPQRPKTILKLYKEYRLYYILSVLYGSRKQLFITFAPWVLVTIFHKDTELMASLLMAGGVIGILFQPLLGWMIDHFGERVVLSAEAVLLVVVCAGYGFARSMFVEDTAFIIVVACYLLDQMLMSVSMARATFMKKIALEPAHIQTALQAGITIDHVFSISVALLGGLVWNFFGYQYVFLMGALIALTNLFFALQVKVPKGEMAPAPRGV
jgi:predicted MFS family arabinose efflux permease